MHEARWWPSPATSRSRWSIPAAWARRARVARWDLVAAEAYEQFHRSPHWAEGLGEFELPCPTSPQNKTLELFVRYVAPDGRKLMSEMTIAVNPPVGNQASVSARALRSTDSRRVARRGAPKTAPAAACSGRAPAVAAR